MGQVKDLFMGFASYVLQNGKGQSINRSLESPNPYLIHVCFLWFQI